METKHTPGPWRIVDGYPDTIGAEWPDKSVGIVAKAWSGESPEQILANARLIAAAPQLLELVNAVVILDKAGLWPKDTAMQGFAADARAAIAATEGRES